MATDEGDGAAGFSGMVRPMDLSLKPPAVSSTVPTTSSPMSASSAAPAPPRELARRLAALVDQISTIVVGKRAQVEDCIACLLAGGHLLIEDVPGVGKTTLAHTLAMSLGLEFRRVQCCLPIS
jgi:hypothetical protein